MPIPLPDPTVTDFRGIQRNFDKIAQSVNPASAPGVVGNAQLQDDAVDARVLADDAAVDANRAVTRNHIRNGAVDSSKIDVDAVGAAQIAPNAVGASELADNAVDGPAIQNGVVTVPKLDPAVPLAKRFAADVGNGAATSIDVVHNLNTKDVLVQVFDNATGTTLIEGGAVLTSVTRATVNKVTLVFAVAPAAAAHRAVVTA